MTRPKITVIIPTRERPDTLEMSLRTVTAQNYDNLEIIVSDNFSCDNTEAVVRRNQDPRIKYINTRKRVSMSHNYEFALAHVQEGWVAIIGDDDGLLPDCLEHVGEILEILARAPSEQAVAITVGLVQVAKALDALGYL